MTHAPKPTKQPLRTAEMNRDEVHNKKRVERPCKWS